MAQRHPLQVRSSNGLVFDSHCPPCSLPLAASSGFPDVPCFPQRPVAADAVPSSQMQQFYLPCNGSGNGHDARRPDIADIEQDLQASSLMRYHSAPSSMLASISIGTREEYMPADASELARMIPISVVSCPSVQFESRSFQQVNEACSFSDGGRVAAVKREDEVRTADGNGHNDPNISRLSSVHSPLKQTAASTGYPVLGAEVQGAKNGNSNLRTCFASPPLHPTSDYPAESKEVFRSGCDNGTDHIMNPSVRFSPPCKSSLLRHSSSPAGFLSLLNDGMAPPSSSGNSSEEGTYEQAAGNYLWPDSIDASGNVLLASPVLAGKRARELDSKYFSGATIPDPRQRELLEHGAPVVNHVSLPMSSSPKNPYTLEGASLDSVLCHARAKRGCATHPRSIAERVRRTKITERIKKLQELVPHMDKQTNTVEMLDEVMEYVKCLQRQVQELKEAQSKCTCNCKQAVHDGS